MLNLNYSPASPQLHNNAQDMPAADARLDRAVNALLMVMALENADMFADAEQIAPGFDELESELSTLQTDELRAAYDRVIETEIAFDTAIAQAQAEAQTEIETARREVETVAQKINRLRAEAAAIENELEPQYRQLANEMDAERQRAAELRNKAAGLNDEARTQFEQKVELVLRARLQPHEARFAVLESERAARRQPLEEQITTLEALQRECEANLERVQSGQGEAQARAAAICDGRAEEGAALFAAVRELLAAREKFSAYLAHVEKSLEPNARMNAIAKRHAEFVAQARLALDAPINAQGALERAKEGQIAEAKRMLELALRGRLDESKANEIRQALAQSEYKSLVNEWKHDLLERAPKLQGMNTVNHYKELITAKAREPGYQTLARDMTRVLAQAEKLARQGVAARRHALENHAAQYINSQNKFFSAQVMPDSGRVMIAVKKNGQWLRHALCQMIEGDSGYEIKTNYYERKSPLDDQSEWDTRRERLERRLEHSPAQHKENNLQ